jgi:hypothetical protein
MVGFTRSLGKIGHMNMRTYTQCATSTLRFQSASNNLIGLLTVGAVIGTGVTITDYVIEWRLGSITGAIQLVTGVGSDPDIQAFHPLVSEPVVGGTLYAVIRYIVIDGIRYSPYFRQGQYSPDLKACLGSVTVVTMNCSNGTSGDYWYPTYVTYNNTLQPANNAERTLRFNLNSDGSSLYFAFEFVAYNVADRIIISYIHISDEENPVVICDWVVGYNATTNYTSNPKVMGSPYNSIKRVLNLTGYNHQSGDYLIIHIIPRVLEPSNTNTNWQFKCKCLPSFNCYAGPSGCRTIDPATVLMEWVPASCWWKLSWKNNAFYNYPASDWSYTNVTQFGGGVGWEGSATERLYLYFRKLENWPVYSILSSNVCNNQIASCRIQKVGNVITFTFQNATDYNRYKDSYTAAVNNANWTNYSSDNTSHLHYKAISIHLDLATSCGDTKTSKQLYGHHNSTFTFDDANYIMVFTVANTTNGITETPCNTKYSQANSIVTLVASTLALADFDVQTSIAYTNPLFLYYQSSATVYDETQKTQNSVAFGGYNASLFDCVPSDWIERSNWIGTYIGYVNGYITNNADPANNFRLSTWLNDDGTLMASPVIVFEMENGVQIIP